MSTLTGAVAPRSVAGVDGARGAWIVALLPVAHRGAARLVTAATFAEVRALVDHHACPVVGVDMPIGLPATGSRSSDTQARARLGARRSTLFPTPVAAVLGATSHADASARNRRDAGVGISVQMWNLVPAIRQVRAAVAPGEAGARFVECHPETSFAMLAGQPLDKKRSAAGVGQRLAALRKVIPGLDGVLANAPATAAIDDALDALAISWSARRHHAGVAEVLGAGTDPAGYPLSIVV